MKKVKQIIATALFIMLTMNSFSQGVGINNDESDADPSAMLDVKSTTKGMLVPRMTSSQMFAINNPAEGLMVFLTDFGEFFYYEGGEWKYMTRDFAYYISDYDFDTGISTGDEGQPDVDKISIFCGNGTLVRFNIDSMRIAPNMNSVFVGKGAGGLFSDRKNVALGDSASFWNGTGATLDYESNWNTAIGSKALFSNTLGSTNTSIGSDALYSNTLGDANNANGFQSLFSNTVGSNNVANGLYSLFSNTTGHSNVAIGAKALFYNQTNSNLVAIGDSALFLNGNGATGNDEANFNTAVGSKALYSNTTGYNNTASGYNALISNTIGSGNVALGAYSLYYNEKGSENTALGCEAGLGNPYGFWVPFDSIVGNTMIGFSAGHEIVNGANYNTFIGVYAGCGSEVNYGNHNVAIGNAASASNYSGSSNVAVGDSALYLNMDGINNTAIGNRAFYSGTVYNNSTAIGYNTVITGDNQIHLGNTSISEIKGQVAFTTYSDKRIKDDIRENVIGLEFIEKLRPVTYHYNVDRENEILGVKDESKSASKYNIEKINFSGFIAQEVENAANESGYNFSGVHKPNNDHDLYSLSYAEFVVPLVKAVQEQQDMIEELKAEIESLKSQIKK